MKHIKIKEALLMEFPHDARKSRNFLKLIDRSIELYIEETVPVYKNGLTPVIVRGLFKLSKAGGKKKLLNINLTKSEFANFQKLRYFGLAIHDRNGVWQITRAGDDFLRGLKPAPRFAFVRKGVVQSFSDERIMIQDVKEGENIREFYRSQAKKHHGIWSLFK